MYSQGSNSRYLGSQPRGGSGSFGSTVRRAVPEWPAGKLIKSIQVSDLSDTATSPRIKNVTYLASYNWIDDPVQPTILVPGSPPLWCPSWSTRSLREDSGEYFRDPNAARYSRHPTEPMVRAIIAMHPEIDLSSFDIVGCGSTFGNLLRFCRGTERSFRFDVDCIGSTVFLIRKEDSPTLVIPNIRGYGHAFPEAHTTWEAEVKGSASHQRIIQYDFDGLKFLVRSESDGYLAHEAGKDAPLKDSSKTKSSLLAEKSARTQTKAIDGDSADELFGALKVSSKPSSGKEPLRILMRGKQIPQRAIFDLKTRARETIRPIDMEEVHRRLWVNQTPFFIFAEHFRGRFEVKDVKPQDVSGGIAAWEEQQKRILKHYSATLKIIISVAKTSATGKLQVIRKSTGPLEIWERVIGDETDVLSEDLVKKWRSQLDEKADFFKEKSQ